MGQQHDTQDQAFRGEVRAFVRDNLTPEMVSAPSLTTVPLDLAQQRRWHKRLDGGGWAVPSWPVEHGGTGWGVRELRIFDEELTAANAPPLSPFVNMVGPVIYTFGTPEQKARHLPPLRSGAVYWCQGYSEPGAGSDLASLRTRAERQGDDYIVNGQKIWTSYAHEADWIFCLVRTSTAGKPQQGISFLLFDMKSPGIEVRPIISLDGLHHLNEVFFRDVRVPVANRIGEENKGWDYAKFLLLHERTTIANVPLIKRQLQQLRRLAASLPEDGKAALKARVADAEIKLLALEYTDIRSVERIERGQPMGAETSMLKVVSTELQQTIAELAVEALGHHAAPWQPEQLVPGTNLPPDGSRESAELLATHLFGRAASIFGGSNEIQRNVLAKAVLGL
jgi:alkylation response protein AidB-like acyl-CoA dehydrogenase